MNLFRAIVVIFFSAIFIYAAHQLTRFAELPLVMNLSVIAFLLLMFALVLAMPLYFWSEERLKHKPWHDSFFDAAHFAMAYINFLVTLIIARDIFSLFANYSPAQNIVDSLYDKEALGILLMLPFIMIVLGTLVVRVGPKVKAIEIFLPHLPSEFEGFKILHITDLHISSSLPMNFVEKLYAATQKLSFDMVAYTGDILDSQAIRHLKEFELMKKISAPHGSFYVPGNHEYYWEIDQALAAFRSIGVNVLINSSIIVKKGSQELQVLGVPDPAARSFQKESPDFEKIRAQVKKGVPSILLSHQPSLADHAAHLEIDIQLSGHTHGGQFFPWNLFIGVFQKYAKGLYKIKNLQLYVNQGTGYWGPSLRLGTYCELTQITLRKS